jgi:hypothetical protein
MPLTKLTIKLVRTDSFIAGRHVIKRFTHCGHILGECVFMRMYGPPLIERLFGGDCLISGRQLCTEKIVKLLEFQAEVGTHNNIPSRFTLS